MQDIPQETHHETTRLTQSALVVLWEIDLTVVGGERYFFCNEQNDKGEPVTWQGRQYQAYPIQGTGFELNGKGSAARPTLTVSNLHGMVTGMAEDLQSLVGGTVVRRKVYARFLDAVNFVNGNSDADPEQEVISRWRIEQCSELSAVSALALIHIFEPTRQEAISSAYFFLKKTKTFFPDMVSSILYFCTSILL
ncbi:phage minor tail protein L, partial [Escherichia coli]|uniref:phage minor tail protein L n=1 Tax=Escherichia coli TaxID=562 RepID=UPI000AF6A5D1